jgi:hypothetical protein
MLKYKNLLIKIADVQTNQDTGIRIFNPVILPEEDSLVYSEFLKVISDSNLLGKYVPGNGTIRSGHHISNLELNKSFELYSGISSLFRTSEVIKKFTPNLFLTRNSLYFLKDKKFFIQKSREEKLNQIIND